MLFVRYKQLFVLLTALLVSSLGLTYLGRQTPQVRVDGVYIGFLQGNLVATQYQGYRRYNHPTFDFVWSNEENAFYIQGGKVVGIRGHQVSIAGFLTKRGDSLEKVQQDAVGLQNDGLVKSVSLSNDANHDAVLNLDFSSGEHLSMFFDQGKMQYFSLR